MILNHIIMLRANARTETREMKIGLLTGGGDCPGLNAAIRAIVRRAFIDGVTIIGVKNGWEGLVKNDVTELSRAAVTGILPRGGTILGTSRFNPLKDEQSINQLKANWRALDLTALIVVGGEGSLSAARDLWLAHQLPIVAIPKTIDNDIRGTDFTFGFDTAVTIVTDAIDRLHSTAESHHRVMVVEVMGRHTGWIAAYGLMHFNTTRGCPPRRWKRRCRSNDRCPTGRSTTVRRGFTRGSCAG